jgi:VanZ family protein
MTLLSVWLFSIFILSVMPVSRSVSDLPEDKIAHVLMYALTSILLFRYYSEKKPVISSFYTSAAVSGLYGAAMEVVQFFLPHRSFSVLDMAANVLGAFMGLLLYITVQSVSKKHPG